VACLRSKVGQRVEELILIAIIILNILVFFNFLPGDIGYVKNIISWAVVGYLMYKISLSRIMFGEKNRTFDVSIVLLYFLLIIKNLVGVAIATGPETDLFQGFYSFLVSNAHVIETTGFYISGIGIIILSILLASGFRIKRPSIMSLIHESGKPPKSIPKRAVRTVTIFLLLVAFFIIVFNLVLEWLAIAVDAPLVMLAIFAYLFLVIRHKEKFGENLLFKIGDVGEAFYEKFVKMFYSKSRVFMAISGLLILHLLTDLGIFFIPYVFGLENILYLSQLGPGHSDLWYLMLFDMQYLATAFDKVILVFVYLLNALALFFLMTGPAYIWYLRYKRRGVRISQALLGVFFASLTCFLILPIFKFRILSDAGYYGVDILTRNVLSFITISVVHILALSIIVGVIAVALSKIKLGKYIVAFLAIFVVEIFFAYYIYLFFTSEITYYLQSVIMLGHIGKYLIAFFFLCFMAIVILFYLVGFIAFVGETLHEVKSIKW
jgi:hypothetical protein